jgi:hypothetical protein
MSHLVYSQKFYKSDQSWNCSTVITTSETNLPRLFHVIRAVTIAAGLSYFYNDGTTGGKITYYVTSLRINLLASKIIQLATDVPASNNTEHRKCNAADSHLQLVTPRWLLASSRFLHNLCTRCNGTNHLSEDSRRQNVKPINWQWPCLRLQGQVVCLALMMKVQICVAERRGNVLRNA